MIRLWMSGNPINPQVWQVQCWVYLSGCPFSFLLSYFFFPLRPWRKETNWTHQVTYLQLDLFYLPHFSPIASIAAAAAAEANYSLSKRKRKKSAKRRSGSLSLYLSLFPSQCCSASTICASSHPGAGILWGTSRKLHLALISFHLPPACWAAHILTHSLPHTHTTACCHWHSYSSAIWHQMLQYPTFWKAISFFTLVWDSQLWAPLSPCCSISKTHRGPHSPALCDLRLWMQLWQA